MLKNFLRVAFRNLKKYKAFSFINIIGLAVGTACCILIFLYVTDELSYDKFNVNSDRIYRVYLQARIHNSDLNTATAPAPMGAAMLDNIPEVESYTRVRNFGFPVMRYKNKAFSEERFYWADSTFFDVFTVHFLEGNPKTALTKPNTVVITEATANKYFGNEDPMGKILNADHRRDYIVTGVVKAFPHNSHFHFDFLGSLSTYEDSRSPFWLSNNYYTYILLHKSADPEKVLSEMKKMAKSYVGIQLQKTVGVSLAQFESAGNRYGYSMQPLTAIHLHSHLDYELQPNSDISYIYIFSAIAIAILLIATINFMNLSTARSERRSKEVGIRKTLGSNRKQLIWQFITESIMLSLLSVFIAIVIVEALMPLFNDISGKQVSLSLLENAYTIPLLFLFAVLVGIIAGSYPAFYLSSFDPVKILKSDNRKGSRKSILRSVLVITQFAVSIILIIGTFVIQDQLNYIQNKDLGFNKEQVVIINKTDDIGSQMDAFKSLLSNYPKVISVSNSTDIPGNQNGDSAYKMQGTSVNETLDLRQINCDFNFVKTYEIKMAAGRFFSKDHPADSMAVVINEATVRKFGITDPVGKNLYEYGRTPDQSIIHPIIGVVKDFNYESLHQQVRPLVMRLFNSGGFGKFVSVRIAAGDYQKTISYLEAIWKKFADDEAFEYNFFDQEWAHLYFAEQRTSKLSMVFSVLAIFIACLGLLGLVAYVTEQRTKEIGIRKVLGASVPEIFILLSKEFTKWVLIANIIAWPLAYYIMHNWLNNFAYRVSIAPLVFIYSGLIALAISIATVSTHAIKAAKSNPVKSLRYE
jgi:putative ABC transport system permease protein